VWLTVTVISVVDEYFGFMDRSVHYLLRGEIPASGEATIHSIAPEVPVRMDDEKIGFTLDVSVRLERERSDDEDGIVPLHGATPEELADSA
jgi:hypothetical protein